MKLGGWGCGNFMDFTFYIPLILKKNNSVILKKKLKMSKICRQTDGLYTKCYLESSILALSSGLLAQVSLKYSHMQ